MKYDPELFETLERLIDQGDAPAIDAILQDRPDAAETYLTLCQLKSDLGLASALEPAQTAKAETGARFQDRAPVSRGSSNRIFTQRHQVHNARTFENTS